jgi:CubicO group peptidase (beta-lactamase class C family)
MKMKPILRARLCRGLVLLLPLALGSPAPAEQGAVPPLYIGDSTVSRATLRDAIEPLFSEDGVEASGETRALLVLHDGRVVAERYAPGYGPHSRQLSWSLAKTVTAVLAGIMVSDGRLALDEPVPVPAWRHGADPRGAITLRQMLNMASGIDHKEQGPPEQSDSLRMLVGDGAGDMARYAESKPLADVPGRRFRYNSATTLILCDMMTRMLTDDDTPQGRRDAMIRFVQQRLAEPAGLTSLTPEFDARGTMIGGAILHMTARDYGRLGELLRNRGRIDGRQIVSESWVRFMTRPSPQNPGYGGHIWLNRPGAEHILFVGDAPKSLYAATGLRGQYVVVSPAQGLTIVRLGITSDEEQAALRAAMARIVRAFPTS